MTLDSDLTQRIRFIFLHPDRQVTMSEAADLLRLTREEFRSAVDDGTIEATATPSGLRVGMREVADYVLQALPVSAVEAALGGDAAKAMPSGVRTEKLAVRLPRYVIAGLERLADNAGETIEAFLTNELHALLCDQKERLAVAIPGFAEAIEWPSVEPTGQLC